MRRTTSALTAAVLGAALTASMVVAQQASPPDDAPSEGAPTAKTAPGTAAEAANSQLYGMSVTRGARYLLRNGLDYLSYQQYDRALKFLREAEARVTDQKAHISDQKGRKVQVELNAAELTALKQGIEAAQRGLRRASNAEASYALSDRSHTGNGFTPAKPSTQLTARNIQTDPPNRRTRAAASTPPGLIGNDGDDDQGQPVRLASGEIPSTNQPAALSPAVRAVASGSSAATGYAAPDEPLNMPETPKIPVASPLPDLTAVNGSEPLSGMDDQNTTRLQSAVRPGSTKSGTNGSPASAAQAPEQTAALVPQPLSVPEGVAPVPQRAEDRNVTDESGQCPGIRKRSGDAT